MTSTTLMRMKTPPLVKTSPVVNRRNRGCHEPPRPTAPSAGFAGASSGGKLERGAKPPFEGGRGA
jgi:hypothetical protein